MRFAPWLAGLLAASMIMGLAPTASAALPLVASGNLLPCDSNGPVGGYVCTPIRYAFRDISRSGTEVPSDNLVGFGLADDDASDPIPLGFDFEYFGNTYSEVTVSSNGLLLFDPGLSGRVSSYSALQFPDADAEVQNAIGLWWEDLAPPIGFGRVLSQSFPGMFVVQFEQVYSYDNGPLTNTFQGKLFPDGSIEVHLKHVVNDDDGSDASIGIENEDGSLGLSALLADESGIWKNIAFRFHRPDAMAQPDLEVFKAADMEVAAVGDTVRFTLTLRNVGAEATGVVLRDMVPGGLALMGPVGTLGPGLDSFSDCDVLTGQRIVCNVVDLEPGDVVVAIYDAEVLRPGNHASSASASHSVRDANPRDNMVRHALKAVVPESIDLRATTSIDLSDAYVALGTTTVLHVDVDNLGPAVATGVVVTIRMSPLVTAIGATDPCTVAGQVVTCLYDSIAAGSGVEIAVSSEPARAGRIMHQVQVSAAERDHDPRNNRATETYQAISSGVDLSWGDNCDGSGCGAAWDFDSNTRWFAIGSTMTLFLEFRNAAPIGATGVRLIGNLPPGFTLVGDSDSPDEWTCSQANRVLTCLWISGDPDDRIFIDPFEQDGFTVDLEVTGTGGPATFTLRSAERDLNPRDNTFRTELRGFVV